MFYSKIRACAIAADTQVAGCIVAAGGTDGIYKNLLPFVEYGILFASVGGIGARAPSSVMNFIEAFKNEELAFVLETLGYLCPYGFELLLRCQASDARQNRLRGCGGVRHDGC